MKIESFGLIVMKCDWVILVQRGHIWNTTDWRFSAAENDDQERSHAIQETFLNDENRGCYL